MMKIQNSKFKIQNFAFTLIELLVVISIIAVLAAFLVPVAGSVERHQRISRAQAEMAQLQTAIDGYKTERGYYPPDNPGNPLTNQLYYELTGTTLTSSSPVKYQSYDGVQTLTGDVPSSDLVQVFGGVTGFLNCTKGGGEDSRAAKNYIGDIKPAQKGTFTANGVSITNLITAVGGPDDNYRPMGVRGLNPWRYVSSNPSNNIGGYDLWVQLKMGSKTNLVCNWSKQPQVNTPWP